MHPASEAQCFLVPEKSRRLVVATAPAGAAIARLTTPASYDRTAALARRRPYQGQNVDQFIADMVIDGKIIVELKAVSTGHPAHEAQAQHDLAATGLRPAILLNFGAAPLEQKRIIRGYEE